MAAYGAQRKLGKTDKQAQDYLLKLFKNVVSQDKSARDSPKTFLAGKGDVLLAYENEALFARSRNQELPFVIPRSTILIEDPIAVMKKSEHKAEANAFSASWHAGRAADLRRERLPAREQGGRARVHGEVPGAARAVHDRPARLGGWDTRRRSGSSTRTRASWHGSSGRSAAPLARLLELTALMLSISFAYSYEHRRRRLQTGQAAEREGHHGPLARSRHDLSPLIVVLPIAALVWESTNGGWQGLLGRGHEPGGGRRAEADALDVDRGRADQRRPRHDHRVGARARRLPRQVARQRDHRPAVRAADDRRRADAARALRAPVAGRHQRRLHDDVDRAGDALRHAAVRRPHRAAGAARARPGDGGGGEVARRVATGRRSAASSSRTSSRGSSRASRSRSRRPSASSARS